jgi:hypothetical protein
MPEAWRSGLPAAAGRDGPRLTLEFPAGLPPLLKALATVAAQVDPDPDAGQDQHGHERKCDDRPFHIDVPLKLGVEELSACLWH